MINDSIKKIKGLFPVTLKTFIKKFRNFNADNKLDLKMLKYINYENGFFIECGANDGVNQSNTWYYEKKLNWRGVLIEPIPEVFKQLKKNRKSENLFFNNVLKSFNDKRKYIRLIYDKKDSLITKIESKKNKNTYSFRSRAKTLNEILTISKAPKKIDFFSLDVEGDEINVLNGVDFKKYYFKYILIETINLKKVINKLKKFDYKLKKKLSNIDYLFKNKISG
jgi:FkbM family methyltransferase